MRRVRIHYVLSWAVCLLVSCGGERDTGVRSVHTYSADDAAAAAMGDEFGDVLRLQRRFLETLADSTRDIGEFASVHEFTLADGSAAPPGPSWSRLVRRPGADYFRLGSTRVSPALGSASEFELFADGAGTVLVLTTHEGTDPAITAWRRTGEEWKAVRMTINVQPETVRGVREHYGRSVARRTR